METWEKAVLTTLSVILVIFSFVIFFMPNGIIQLGTKKTQMAEATKINADIETENKGLCREVIRLKSDPQYLENVARKELGMIKDDEIIIKFHSDK